MFFLIVCLQAAVAGQKAILSPGKWCNPTWLGPEAKEERVIQEPLEMRAAVYWRHGLADTVLEVREEYPVPTPKEDELLIRVAAAGLNPVDVKLRNDRIRTFMRPLPKVTGCDIAGYVEAAPEGSSFKHGDTVFAMLDILGEYGGVADFAIAKQKNVARAPTSGFIKAGSLALTSLTILQTVDPIVEKYWQNDAKGKRVLVQAASGGLGTFAVQFCANVLGMEVTAVCSGRNADYVRSLGAKHVVDYTKEDFTEVVTGMDLVIDPLRFMNERKTWNSNVLAPGGAFNYSVSLMSNLHRFNHLLNNVGNMFRSTKTHDHHCAGHYASIASSNWDQSKERQDPLGVAIPEARIDTIMLEKARSFWRNSLATLMSSKPFHHGPTFVQPNGDQLERVRQYVDAKKVLPQVDHVYSIEQIAEAHKHVESGRTRGKVVINLESS